MNPVTQVSMQLPLSERQQKVAESLHATVTEVVKNILMLLIRSQSLSPKEFVERNAAPCQGALSQLDEFFSKVIVAVNERASPASIF
ncbi:MAG: hypothetical protein ACSNEK_00685 [Parachlamydiaceae bacterium]